MESYIENTIREFLKNVKVVDNTYWKSLHYYETKHSMSDLYNLEKKLKPALVQLCKKYEKCHKGLKKKELYDKLKKSKRFHIERAIMYLIERIKEDYQEDHMSTWKNMNYFGSSQSDDIKYDTKTLFDFSIQLLKELCKKKGIKRSGTKQQLIYRLMDKKTQESKKKTKKPDREIFFNKALKKLKTNDSLSLHVLDANLNLYYNKHLNFIFEKFKRNRSFVYRVIGKMTEEKKRKNLTKQDVITCIDKKLEFVFPLNLDV